MSKKHVGITNTFDKAFIERMIDDFTQFAIEDPKMLIAFVGSFSKKMHELAKQRTGGDSTADPKNFAAILFILMRESERGCALAAASYLEEELASLLKGYFVNDKKYTDMLFGPSGPLDSFSSRIILAYCLGLISKTAQRDLNIIRRIRNKFAHTSEDVTFDHTDIRNQCKELYYDVYKETLTPRLKFVRAVGSVAIEIRDSMSSSKRCVKKKDLDIDKFFTDEERDFLLKTINSYRDKKLKELTKQET